MSIQPDSWIRKMAHEHGMIEPFVEKQVSTHVISYGVSSYGWGITVLFAGLQLNWDFAQVWDFKDADDRGFQSSFWIGTRF